MILMQAPGPNETFVGMPSGSTYVSTAQSLIFIMNNSTADQIALAAAGCVTLSPAGFWGAGTFNLLSDLYAADAMTAIFLPGLVGFPAHMTAAVQADPTTSNNGLWYKTGTGNGAGNWTQTSATLTPNANAIQAAASATAAQVAAAQALVSQGQAAAYAASVAAASTYGSAYATALPQGLTAINIGGTAITGATPGTYALTPVGGSLTGVAANLIVTSATAATIQIVNPGVGTGTTPPTFANPSAATLPSGTTLTGVVGTLIANQKPYWVVSADGTQLLLYGNNAGSVATYPFGSTQASLPMTPSLSALISSLSSNSYQYIGRPSGTTPITGGGVGTNTYFWNNVVAQAGTLSQFNFWAAGTGTLYLAKYTLSGSTLTRTWISPAITIAATGPQNLTATQFNGGTPLSVAANEIIAFSGSGIVADTSNTADGTGWSSTTAGCPASGTVTAGTSSVRLEAQAVIAYPVQTVTATAFAVAQANAASAVAATNQLTGTIPQTIGRPTTATLTTGTGFSNPTYVANIPVTNSGTLTTLQLFALTTGTVTVSRFSLSGTTLSLIASQTATVSATGSQSLTLNMSVNAGDYLGIAGTGIFCYVTGTQDAAWWSVAPSGGNAVSPITGFVFQMRFNFTSTLQTVTATSFAAEQAARIAGDAANLALITGNLSGKNVGIIGDSLSSIYDWQTDFKARSGAILQWRDARPGRTFAQALEGFGASSPLASVASLTGYNGSIVVSGSSTLSSFNANTNTAVPNTAVGDPTAGTTLSALLAQLDILQIVLGTNDLLAFAYYNNIGTPSDAYTAGTMYAAMNFALDAIVTNAPTLPVLGITNTRRYDYAYTEAQYQATAAAITTAFNQRGFPVLNLVNESGIGALNYTQRLLGDGIHWNPAQRTYNGRLIAEFAKRHI